MAKTGTNRDRAEALASRVTVGIVTALPEERAAMLAMLDQPVSWSIPGRGAGRVYDLGEIVAHDGGRHVVALGLADMGNDIAATRGSQMLHHFPAIEAILMVGIAGGVPNPEKASEHVRLGDVVVSDRFGVIQYDFLKKTAKINEVRSSPRPPHPRLLEAARLLEADAVAGKRPWEAHVLRAAAHLAGATRPDVSTDVLLSSRAPFQALKHPVDRRRVEGQPRIFFGPIASANTLLKDPGTRDRLREQHGAKAVEMEGAGIADATWQADVGYLVVRGICDYCDKNKNDEWHIYAAVVAAAYARAVLEHMATDGLYERGEPPSEPPKNKPSAPNNLRARNPYFRGREGELARLGQALIQERQATLTRASVFGLGGVGKSALALEYAHLALERGDYPGGIWWVAAEGDPVDALVRLAPTLRGHAPTEVRTALSAGETRAEVIAEEVRLGLQAPRAPSLLVLDNVSESGWGKYVPTGAVRVLMTTRDAGLALGEPQRLDVLSATDARAMAEVIGGEPPNDAEREAFDRVIVTELGGLAVAVEMAAHAVKRWFHGSWAAYEKVLRDEMEGVLDDRKLWGDYGRGVFAAIDLSLNNCDATERALLEGASVFAPQDVPVEWALAAAGMKAARFDAVRAMEVLGELGLVTKDKEKPVVSMHRLVHRRVRGRAEKEHNAAREEVTRRGVESVVEWICAAVELCQTRAEMDAIDARREHVDQALNAAEKLGSNHAWIDIANKLATHLSNRAQHNEALALFQKVLTKAESLTPSDPISVSIALSNLAQSHHNLSQLATGRPLAERALLLAETTYGSDHPAIVPSLKTVALLQKDAGQPAIALSLLERALTIDEAFYGPNQSIVATDLSNLAVVHNDLDQPTLARPMLERALAITEATSGRDHPAVAVILSNLATSLYALGELSAARSLLERALTIEEATYGSDHPIVATSLSNLGIIHRNLKDPDAALPLLKRALTIGAAAYGSDYLTATSRLSHLALVHMDLGQPTEARPLLERAITIAEKTYSPNHPTLALLRLQLANILLAIGRQNGRNGAWETARHLAEQSLKLAKRTDQPLLITQSYRLLADAALHASDYENAQLFYEETIRRADALDQTEDAATARLLLVTLLLQLGHIRRRAAHVARLRAHLANAEIGPVDRAEIEDVLRLVDAAQAGAASPGEQEIAT